MTRGPSGGDVKVVVIGAGSAGARHVRTLRAAGAYVAVCDPDGERSAAAGADEVVPFDLDHLGDFDGIVVASPTAFHLQQAAAALGTGARVLVEKPLAASTSGLDGVLTQGRHRLMIGYNLRLHDPLRRFVDLVHHGVAGRIWSARAWFGSWLPDWRPAVDYRSTYSARAHLGGGILLDAIHELDLLVWTMGDGRFEVLGALVARVGPLEIDVEDTVKAVLLHASGAGVELSLDYLSRRYRRGIEVTGERATVRLDWARQVLELEDATGVRTEPATTSLQRSYERQAERFLAFVRGEAEPPVGGEEGAASVRLAECIRAAAARPA